MEFRKYEDIEGIWNKKTMEYFEEHNCFDPKIVWVVTEKIDGSNFSFYYNGQEMKFARREGFIDNLQSFFRCDTMIEKYKTKIINLYEHLKNQELLKSEIIVYGELFGGALPGFKSHVKRINKGVFYAPELEFYVFDVYLNNESYMSVSELIKACRHVGLFCIESLDCGTFDEIKNHPNNFNSTITKRLGFEIELKNNVTEGLVLKPNVSFYVGNTRVILKSKNEKFYDTARSKTNKEEKREKNIKENLIPVVEEISLYVTENRLRTVLSKIGEFSKSDFNKILNLFKNDVWKDYGKEGHDTVFFEEDRKLIDSILNKKCVEILRPIFLEEAI